MITFLGIVLNIVTLFFMFSKLRKYWWSPIGTSLAQFPWIWYIILLGPEAYPMLITAIPVLIMNVCFIKKWYKERDKL